jgi:WD40 repeat protein
LRTEVKTLRGHTDKTNDVAYSYDGQYLASCSDDKTIKIWSTDINSKEALLTLTGHDTQVLTVLYSFDSKRLASADEKGVVKIWEMPSGTLLRTITAHNEIVQSVSWAEDNRTIVTASLDKFVKLWNSDTGENLMSMDVGSDIWGVDLTSSADHIMVGCADGSVKMLVEKKEAIKGKEKPKGKGGKK